VSAVLRILVVLLLILGSALFVAAEYALITARRTRLEERALHGGRGARTALRLMDEPDGVELYTLKEIPEDMKAVVVVVHGLAEHLGRYEYLKDRLLSFGYGVYRFDNRGHGLSGGARGYVESYDNFIEDANVLVDLAKAENPDLPIFMFGHSMGGFIAASYGVKYTDKLDGIILSGAATASLPAIEGGLNREFDPMTAVPNSLSSIICTDKSVVKAYEDDLLVLKETTLKLLTELIDGIKWLDSRVETFNYPCLILHGSNDMIVPKECSEFFFKNISSADKKLIIYPGLFHEILNEKKKDSIINDIHEWIKEKI
jgi:alpha-beta hydrolase superfamily lysophospholipase